VRLGDAMSRTVDALVALVGFSYVGLDAGGLEPLFRSEDGQVIPFDALPTRARHLVAFGALTVRALWGAYPMRDPLEAEAVVGIDEIELQQDAAVLGSLLDCLRNVLPRVQWIVTTTSPVVAASASEREVFALRKLPRAHEVQLFTGAEARVH
jgi:predicted ATP-binding protein involved in virulence